MAGDETAWSAQVSVLQETFRARSAQPAAPAALREARLPEDAEHGGGASVARPGGKPAVLEWAGQCGPRAGLAEGASELLERTGKAGRSLTKRLRSESRCWRGR